MAKFHDVIAALQGIEGDYPGDMFDQLTGAYDEDISGVGAEIEATAAAKVAQLTNEAVEMEKALEAAKAHNYDLLMSQPSTEEEPAPDEDSGDEETDEGINSLFDENEESK